jgi:hypothetical protein
MLYLSAALLMFGRALSAQKDVASKVGGLAVISLLAALVQDFVPKPLKEALFFENSSPASGA